MATDYLAQGATTYRKSRYTYSSSLKEDDSYDPQTTYGVQFCLRPSKYYRQGGGSIWTGHPPRIPSRMATLEPLSTSQRPNVETPGMDARKESICVVDDSDSEVVEVTARREKEKWLNLFATCNGSKVRIYESRTKQKPLLLQTYEDDDHEEQFYCVAWTYNADGKNEWWACAAGYKGVLRVVNVQRGYLEMSLTGHGEAINDFKVHPHDPALVITASKDESLRLWNLRTGSTVAIFAGLKGHRGEVLYVDFDREGSRFASCGIDNSVRLWHLKEDVKVMNAIKETHRAADCGISGMYICAEEAGAKKRARVPICQFPYFETSKVHKHYVDCVMWVGDLLLSKSIHNRIFLWEPVADRESLASPTNEYTLLEEYLLAKCDVWFIRFALDRNRKMLACGNDKVRHGTSSPKLGSPLKILTCPFTQWPFLIPFLSILFSRAL